MIRGTPSDALVDVYLWRRASPLCRVYNTGFYYCVGSCSYYRINKALQTLPIIEVVMNSKKLRALVDSGCTTTLVTPEITDDWNDKSRITVLDDRDVDCKGISLMKLVVSGMKLNINAVVMHRMVEGIEKWIDLGVLVPWEKEVEVGVLPLMVVLQPMKGKVRPAFDFRKVNSHVECHTGEVVDVCRETLRKWRRMTGASKMVDLKSAYLQLRASKNLWEYQLIRYKGRTYCFTRLGFGLNSGPKIRSTILRKILEKMEKLDGTVSSYIDDIIFNETEMTMEV